MAMTLGDEGTEDQKAHKKDSSFQWGRSRGKGRARGGRKTFPAILLKAATRVLSMREKSGDEGVRQKMKP